MEPVTGIFKTRADAKRAMTELEAAGIPPEDTSLLSPNAPEGQLARVPVTDAEQPGTGKVMGGVVGGAVGAAGGLGLGAAAASIFIPAVGPVLAIGLVGAALFGTGGAIGGAIAGEALEQGMDEGLPVDEMFIYENALRQGRSVVIVLAKESLRADIAREVMRQMGAESIDSARENWWVGLRDAEKESYKEPESDFDSVERNYRSGFEAALKPRTRGKSYEDGASYLSATYPETYSDDSFRRGYERGQSHYQALSTKNKGSD
ncbi:MAG: hypothetical protein AABN34_02070 [Acidobacteriota bacterium]